MSPYGPNKGTPTFGRLFMFAFALFLIVVLLTGGKAFAEGTETERIAEAICEQYRPRIISESEIECEGEPNDEVEEPENEMESVEATPGMAEVFQARISIALHRSRHTVPSDRCSAPCRGRHEKRCRRRTVCHSARRHGNGHR